VISRSDDGVTEQNLKPEQHHRHHQQLVCTSTAHITHTKVYRLESNDDQQHVNVLDRRHFLLRQERVCLIPLDAQIAAANRHTSNGRRGAFVGANLFCDAIAGIVRASAD